MAPCTGKRPLRKVPPFQFQFVEERKVFTINGPDDDDGCCISLCNSVCGSFHVCTYLTAHWMYCKDSESSGFPPFFLSFASEERRRQLGFWLDASHPVVLEQIKHFPSTSLHDGGVPFIKGRIPCGSFPIQRGAHFSNQADIYFEIKSQRLRAPSGRITSTMYQFSPSSFSFNFLQAHTPSPAIFFISAHAFTTWCLIAGWHSGKYWTVKQ